MSGDRQRGRQAYHGLLFASKQWGSSGTPSNYLVTVNLPISFTDGAYVAVALASLLNSNTNHDTPIVAKWESATKATFTFGTTMPQAPSCRYIILGR